MKKIQDKRESTLSQIDSKLHAKQVELNNIIDVIDTETRNIHEYIDTFPLSPHDRLNVLHKLVDSRVKMYSKPKRQLVFYIQKMKKQREIFVENISELENIELAFMNEDYKNIIQLWNIKILKAVNSLQLLFSLLQFSLEKRTILFVKKYLDINIVYTHTCCFYELQSLISDIIIQRDPKISTTLYHNELGVKLNVDNLKMLLSKTKGTFRETMIYFYRQYLPFLNDDILLLIIHYIFVDYRL